MTLRIGYLLPTREAIMEGRPEAEPLLGLAERAEQLGYDSVWVGDSLLARRAGAGGAAFRRLVSDRPRLEALGRGRALLVADARLQLNGC